MSISFIALLGVVACNGLSDNQVVGRYSLVSVDAKENTTLSYQLEDGNYVGVVDKVVFAIGFDDSYIIAKQHPSNNRGVANYYIVPVYKKPTLSPEKGVIGPLTADQFMVKRKELGISEKLTFTKVIEDL